jgi:energy-coupling factor transporter ATP-binding protein EcfA2
MADKTDAPSPPKKPQAPPKKPGAGSAEKKPAKSFKAVSLSGSGEGEKIMLYAKSGSGKTTAAAQIEGAVFIPLDDGARKTANPVTGKPVTAVDPDSIEDWDDLREAVRQTPDYVPENGTLVIDTITRAQPLAEEWVVRNIKKENGTQAKNLEGFGFGKGYRHVLDQFRLLLTDLDTVVRSGRNVVLIGQLDQTIVANPEGTDYFCEVPKLIENKQGPVRTEVCEWCDQVWRIGYLNMEVEKESDNSRAGKVSGDVERAVFTGSALHYLAKSRPINGRKLPAIVSFETPEDDSIWLYVLKGATPPEDEEINN